MHQATVNQRLEEFGYEVMLDDPRDLVALIKSKLLKPEDGDVHVYTARTTRELERLSTGDVVVFDTGSEISIIWHDCCLRLR